MKSDYELKIDTPVLLTIERVKRKPGEIHIWVSKMGKSFMPDQLCGRVPHRDMNLSDFNISRNRNPLPIHYCDSTYDYNGLYILGVPKRKHYTNIELSIKQYLFDTIQVGYASLPQLALKTKCIL